MWGEKKNFLSTLLGSWLRHPCNKKTDWWEKNKQNIDNMYTSCTLRKDAQENWVTSPDGPSCHLKYHLQIKKKDLEVVELGEGQYGKLLGKAEWTRTRLLCRFKSLPSALIRIFRVILLFPLQKGRHSLKNGDFLYICRYLFQKGNFYLVFRASPVSGLSWK